MPDDAARPGGADPATVAPDPRPEVVRVGDDSRGARRPPAWLGRALWVLAVVAILGPFLVFPVTLEAGDNAGDEVALARIVRSFDRTLAATGWGETARLLVWLAAGLALIAAFSLLWVAFADEE